MNHYLVIKAVCNVTEKYESVCNVTKEFGGSVKRSVAGACTPSSWNSCSRLGQSATVHWRYAPGKAHYTTVDR